MMASVEETVDRKTSVRIGTVQETLLVTLRAKAADSRSKHSVLGDYEADRILGMIDYDFGKLKQAGGDTFIAVRARQYDEWLRHFLRLNTSAVVVNLGCGLDTRIKRISPSPQVRWFDVDYPEVIALREHFFSNRDGYTMIGCSITSAEWLDEIPKDLPTIVVAEGVLPYLVADEVRVLFNRVTDSFPHGEVLFDVMNARAVEFGPSVAGDATGALHRWSVEDLDEVDRIDAKLTRVEEVSVFRSPYSRRLPWTQRLAYGFISLFPAYRDTMRMLRCEF
jgi:O-methyltransferase involved in polyketide biosynthesis